MKAKKQTLSLRIAIFLSAAAILGLFGLNEAKLPNIGVALAQARAYFANRLPDTRLEGKAVQNPIPVGDGNTQFQGQAKLSIQPPMKDAGDPYIRGQGSGKMTRKSR